MKFYRSMLCGGSLTALLVLASGASASGISVARFGGEHGHPMTTNATSLYYNPAGIAMSEGFHVFVDGTFAWRKASYEHKLQPAEPGTFNEDGSVPGANDGRADLFNIIASPMIGVTAKFGDFAAGAAFYTPFGGQSVWSKNDKFEGDPSFAGPVDGQQRFYNISGQIRSSFITAGLGYHLKDAGLAFGLSGNLILSTTHTIRAKGLSGSNSLAGEGRAVLDAKGTDFSMGVGALWEAMKEQLWIGASYQSRPNFTGMSAQTGTQETFLGADEKPVTAEFYTDLPDVIRAGVTYKLDPETELRLFGDYTRWSVLEDHFVVNPDLGDGGTEECEYKERVPGNPPALGSCLLSQKRDWSDTFGVRVGASRWLNKETELFAGAGYSSNAIPDKYLEPALTDFNSISLSLGGRLEVVKNFNVALSYTQLFYLTRDTDGKSDHDLARGPSGTPNSIENGPDTGGVYKQMIGVVNANVDVQF
ncbi:MAG TPA: outer membrane protein transport protein [Polyangiaceae bacterium]|nr:outer membrane protein transport protein [Polyangiaceae bacterium]